MESMGRSVHGMDRGGGVNKGGSVDSVGSSVDERASVDSVRNSVGNNMHGLRDGFALVPHISHESSDRVSVVGHDPNSAVRLLNTVLSLYNSVSILSLSLGEVSAILISSSVLIGEGLGGFLYIGGGVGN